MNGIPTNPPSASPEPQVPAQAAERPAPVVRPTTGSDPTGETDQAEKVAAEASSPQDEVKVQWDDSDRVEIYQFVNQQGSLILQVPSEQLLSLARQISVELAKDAAEQSAAGKGGKEK